MKTLCVRLGLLLLAVALLLVLATSIRPRPTVAPSARVSAQAHQPAESGRPTAVSAPIERAPAPTAAAAAPSPARVNAIRDEALSQTAAFNDWLVTWRRADAGSQPALASTGRDLAVARRSALKALIPVDARLALELAVPVGLRAELPADVQAQLERRVDQRGNLEATIACFGPTTLFNRTAVVAGEFLETHVFGRRDSQTTKFGLPLHGIAIDNVLALGESPFRILDDGEKTARDLPIDSTAIAIGEDVVVLSSPADLEQLSRDLITAESKVGPHVQTSNTGSSSPGPIDPASGTPPTAATTPWILGAKRVLWVQVDFSDDTGGVATPEQIAVTNTQVSDFYAANSQGKTTMAFTVLPVVLRLPRDKGVYNASSATVTMLQSDAAILAKAYDAANGAAGTYDPDRYDRWIVLFKRVPAYTFGGQAQLTGPQVRMNGTISPTTTAHELGHTQGLRHAHYWLPSGTSGAGAGAHVEYGDVFDNMGGGNAITGHFGAAQKNQLGYLDSTTVTTVTESGTYRLSRHDHADATGARGLKLTPAGQAYDYWIDHRRAGPPSFNNAQLDRLRNGVVIRWGQGRAPSTTSGPGTYLVDATPGSAGGANDAPLRTGETFVDADAGVTIKPLAVGGTAPNEYIDVQIGLGAFDGNRNPVLQAALPPGTLRARTNLIFTASATDPDRDPIYFRWDFGDRQINPSLDNITRRFAKGGTYSLRVSAHDGRGGIAAQTIELNVADPLLAWTQRGAGVTTAVLNAALFAGGKFVAAGDASTVLHSTDGIAWSPGTAPEGLNFRGLSHNGARYVAVASRTTAPRGGAVFSDDGITWTAATLPSDAGQIYAVTFGGGRFVAVGELGRIYSSTDGAAWTSVASPVTNSLRAVAHADGLFLVAGDSGRLLASADGLEWANRSVATANQLLNIVRHEGVWHAFSATAECFLSPDGNAWTRIATTGRPNPVSRFISTGGVLFGPSTAGSIAFTEDPKSWTTHQMEAAAATNFNGTAEGKGLLIVVGSRGLIYSAAAPAPTSGGLAAPTLRIEADSLKVAAGKKNVLAASGTGFTKLELYANGTKVSELNGTAGALEWTPRNIGNYSLVVRGVDSTGASFVSAPVAAVAGLPRWTWSNATPIGADLQTAVRVGDKWWVIGRAGAFITVDGNGTVTPVDFPTSQHLNAIAYANGRFIVTSSLIDAGSKEEIGSLWTSTDGYSWTPLLTTIFDNFTVNFASHNGDRWLVGTNNGFFLTSIDGLVWTRQVSGVTTSLRHAVFGSNQWVAVGAGGRILTSPNGVTWTSRTSGTTNDFWSVAYQDGTFVAVGLAGTIVRSTDGITWTRPTSGITSGLFSVTAWNGAFTAVGNSGVVLQSPDGNAWTPVSAEGKFSDFFGIVGHGQEGIMVGRAGEIYLTSNGHPGWRRVTQGTAETRQGVIYAGGRFVSVGSATDPVTRATIVPITTSRDGINWTRAAALAGFNTINDVIYGQQVYAAAADAGRIFTSSDATTWTQRTSGTAQQLHAIAASPTLFVAAGAGGVITTSTDATTWATRTSGTTNILRSAVYGNGRFVVVGDAGTVLTGTDGTTWTAVTSGVTLPLLAVGWWENVGFIAVGNTGTMISSNDGITWQQVETGVSDTLTAIANTPIGLVAAGGTNGTLIVSLDGASWSIATLPADHTIRGLAASSTAIVAVGDSGNTLAFEVVDTRPAPVITTPPVSQSIGAGANVTLTVNAQNASGAVFQWLKDGVPIVGANTPTLTIAKVSAAQTGAYTVAVSSPTGSVTSVPAMLTFGAAADPGRLINLSIRTDLTSAADTFTFGVVVGGAGTTGSKPLLVRAAGPSLAAFGVTGTLQDPKLEFFTGNVKVGENDNWGGSDALRITMAEVGAFPYAATTSRDAAIALPSLASGANSARISGTGAGVVLAELYDATPTGSFVTTTPRLVNVSVLKHLGTGVTAGFVIGGSTPRSVLIRAIGPTLGTAFGLSNVVADPRLALFSGSTQIGSNDNWGGTSALTAAFAQLAAFALPSDSRDAALLVELRPGNYTVQVSGVAATTGVALVEIYEVP